LTKAIRSPTQTGATLGIVARSGCEEVTRWSGREALVSSVPRWALPCSPWR
jgi:hypothetical protein